jgi:hypothetical protein
MRATNDPFRAQVRKLLAEMVDATGQRLDANETAFAEREITQIRTKLFEVVYAELKAAGFVPIASDISPDVQQYVYYVLDHVGEAKIIANGAEDIPRVDVSKTERYGVVRTVAASYGWELFEMRLAARLGTALSQMRADAARGAIQRQIDKILSTGGTDSQAGGVAGNGLLGVLNNTDIFGLGTATMAKWVMGTTTAAAMIGFLNTAVQLIITATNEAWIPDSLILPTNMYGIFAATPYGADAATVTALNWFLQNSPYIKTVSTWYRGNGAGAAGSDRGLVYKKDPTVLEGVVPLAFESLPPQAQGLQMVVPCVARAGGVKVYHPEACRYLDFT